MHHQKITTCRSASLISAPHLFPLPSNSLKFSLGNIEKFVYSLKPNPKQIRNRQQLSPSLSLFRAHKFNQRLNGAGSFIFSSNFLKMKETRDGSKKDMHSKNPSVTSLPLILDVDDSKGEFSFNALFVNLVYELLPSFQEEEIDSIGVHNNIASDAFPNGHVWGASYAIKLSEGLTTPLFPVVDKLLALFKDSSQELVHLQKQIGSKLYNLKKDVAAQDSKHRNTYLMEFNGNPGDLMELSPLFSNDSRVAEAASIAQKLRIEEFVGKHISSSRNQHHFFPEKFDHRKFPCSLTEGLQATSRNVARGLSSLYKEITGRKMERLANSGFCLMNLLNLDCMFCRYSKKRSRNDNGSIFFSEWCYVSLSPGMLRY
ncbi:unnamed protein product [Citrullus colocynthis]|uniref:Uncharacterized protein n=1 Tax=Citrullus colocynthis TaxID=252529 RepID=A0ABP0YJ46_9ROSI